MRNVYVSRWLKLMLLVLFGAALAACGRDDIKGGTAEATNAPATFDLTIAADKDGQFDVDGATLTAQDLRDHIRYRNEPGNKAVHAILLKPGDKQKVKNVHVAALASVARDLKVEAYVRDNDGRLKVIRISDN